MIQVETPLCPPETETPTVTPTVTPPQITETPTITPTVPTQTATPLPQGCESLVVNPTSWVIGNVAKMKLTGHGIAMEGGEVLVVGSDRVADSDLNKEIF
jgi:hypothetical protein